MTQSHFQLSESAANRVRELVSADPAQKALRVSVLAGGCNGFQYRFALENAVTQDDVVIERLGALVAVDPDSLELLAGAELHYVEELMGSYFSVRNPNATSSCGCGTSFSVD